ncbi:MAG: Heat shock protein HtpX, partial [Berkelbacteria bacterium GW2011_GWA1_36_9]
ADRKYPVKILESSEVNAFCTFDSRIYVNTGLLKIATNDELFFVLAHEASHGNYGDPEESFKERLKMAIGLSNAGVNAEKLIPKLILGVTEGSYSRDKERRADNDAVEGLFNARRNPEAAITLLQKLDKLHSGHQGLGRYFANHPPAKRRIELASLEITSYKKSQRLSKEVGKKAKIIDSTPFIAAFEKKPVSGYVYCGFGGKKSLFYVFYKGEGEIKHKKNRITLPTEVEEVVIVFRNPKPENWIDGQVYMRSGFSVVISGSKEQPSLALAMKLPASLALSDTVSLFGSYGYNAIHTKATDKYACEFADLEFTH